jgi:hypothetical protein
MQCGAAIARTTAISAARMAASFVCMTVLSLPIRL